MRKKKAIAALIGVAILFVTAVTPSCKKQNEEPELNGNHEVEITVTDEYFVRNNRSDYKILIADEPTEYERIAADEMVEFFYQATGAKLPVVEDTGRSYSATAKYISVGENNYQASSGIVKDSTIEGDGFTIQTKGKSVFLLGAADRGNLNAAYELMHHYFGFDAISVDEFSVEKHDDLKFLEMDIREQPDYLYRYMSCVGVANIYPDYARRMRLLSWRDEYIFPNYGGDGLGGAWWDTAMYLLPKDIYQAEHPDWYNTQGNDVCYSNDEMLDFAADRLMEFIAMVPDREFIMFGMSDVTNGCECKKCLEFTEKYGAYSSTAIYAANRMINRIRPWFKENFPNRPMIKLGFFVYYATLEAPVVKNEKGEWVPTSPDMYVDDDVWLLCPPIRASYGVPYYHEDNRTEAGDPIEGWGVLAKNITIWSYNTNFSHYMYLFDIFNVQQENIKFCKESGANGFYEQSYTSPYGREGGLGGTAWFELKMYLSAKLLWNVNADYETLIDKYFQAQFRDAAPMLREFFDSERELIAYNRIASDYADTIYYNVAQKKYWPKGELDRWTGLFEQAFKAIEKYKTSDPALYKKVYNHICVEKLSLDYMLLTLYADSYTSDELYEARKAFRNEVERLNVECWREGRGNFEDVFNSWGV